jgi:hypothetical protein
MPNATRQIIRTLHTPQAACASYGTCRMPPETTRMPLVHTHTHAHAHAQMPHTQTALHAHMPLALSHMHTEAETRMLTRAHDTYHTRTWHILLHAHMPPSPPSHMARTCTHTHAHGTHTHAACRMRIYGACHMPPAYAHTHMHTRMPHGI